MNRRSRIVPMLLMCVLVPIGLAGCNSSSDRRLATSAADPNAGGSVPAGGEVPTTPAPTPPPRPIPPECGPLNLFQLMNYSIGLIDAKKNPEKKDEAVKALTETGAGVGKQTPELSSSIKMIVLYHQYRFEDKGIPTPSNGDPTLDEANAKIGKWSADHQC